MTLNLVKAKNKALYSIVFVEYISRWAGRVTPYTIGLLAANLKEAEVIHYNSNIVLLQFEHNLSIQSQVNFIEGYKPDYLLFSCQPWGFNNIRSVVQQIRNILPRCVIILGGNHVESRPKEIFCHLQGIDYIVTSEGETVLPVLLSACIKKQIDKAKKTRGLAYVEHGIVITNPPYPLIKNLDNIRSPYLDGIINFNINEYDTVLLETDRGCPYGCTYCGWVGCHGRMVREFSNERVCQELEYLVKRKVRHIALANANFGFMSRDSDIIDVIIKLKKQYGYLERFSTSWALNTGFWTLDMVDKLLQNGIESQPTCALQTLSEEAGKRNRRSNALKEDLPDIINKFKAKGIPYVTELIWPLPGETYETFEHNVSKLCELGVDFIRLFQLMIHPGSELYNCREKEKLSSITTEEDADDFEYVISTASVNVDNFHRGMSLYFAVFVLYNSIYFRRITHLLRHAASIRYEAQFEKFVVWLHKSKNSVAMQLQAIYTEWIGRHGRGKGHMQKSVAAILETNTFQSFDMIKDFAIFLCKKSKPYLIEVILDLSNYCFYFTEIYTKR